MVEPRHRSPASVIAGAPQPEQPAHRQRAQRYERMNDGHRRQQIELVHRLSGLNLIPAEQCFYIKHICQEKISSLVGFRVVIRNNFLKKIVPKNELFSKMIRNLCIFLLLTAHCLNAFPTSSSWSAERDDNSSDKDYSEAESEANVPQTKARGKKPINSAEIGEASRKGKGPWKPVTDKEIDDFIKELVENNPEYAPPPSDGKANLSGDDDETELLDDSIDFNSSDDDYSLNASSSKKKETAKKGKGTTTQPQNKKRGAKKVESKSVAQPPKADKAKATKKSDTKGKAGGTKATPTQKKQRFSR
uniref:Uncharacterized protein n=1 Tax=Globodera rostochiensis TaxID=31243 RepID=A0A914I0M4_GLORO